MKRGLLFGLLAIVMSFSLIAQDNPGEQKIPNKGDSEWDVRKLLGRPMGILQDGNEKILSYDIGEITIVDGKVARMELLPDGATYSAMAENSQAALEKRQAMEAELNRQKLAKLKNSDSFEGLSAEEKKKKLEEFAASNNLGEDAEFLPEGIDDQIAEEKAAKDKADKEAMEKELKELKEANKPKTPPTEYTYEEQKAQGGYGK